MIMLKRGSKRDAQASAEPTLRVYFRRSKADEGHQQFSIDTQREGARLFVGDALPRFGAQVEWMDRVEYLDDDRAGDDFLGRADLRRLRDEIKHGDVIVCRDQSRLGRDALEVTIAVRDIVQERGGRLFYYIEGREVPYASVIDAAMTFVRGVGHQMEVEAIRSRVKEALRSRVRAGRIAGGRCFGYALRRERDGSGREYTVAVIDDKEAEIVRRIFAMYVLGAGLKKIAISLNDEGILPPRAGRRGTGSWSPGAIREMLRNHRYRGVYIHGRVKRVRRGGKRIATLAPPEEILTVEVPEWRILDDSTWFAAQERIVERGKNAVAPGPAVRYALSGRARCAHCGGAIGTQRMKVGGRGRVPVYACDWHHRRGDSVCPVKLRQPIDEVDGALAQYLADNILTDAVADEIMAMCREDVERQMELTARDGKVLDEELTVMRAEQRNLALAVATGGTAIPELVGELRKRNERVRLLETDLAAIERTPARTRELLKATDFLVRTALANLRKTLLESPGEAREVFEEVFPEGLQMREVEHAGRRVWAITGMAQLDRSTLKSE
jgi:site-specific DNA recombinase